MQRSLLLFVLICFSSSVFGLSVTSVSGASAYKTTGTVTIYGGLAGLSTTCTGSDGISTCNSCVPTNNCGATFPLCACNSQRIYNDLKLTISLQKNEANTAPAIVLNQSSSLALANSNDGKSVSLTWRTICGAAAGSPDCESLTASNKTISLKIVIDKDGNNGLTTGEESVDVTFDIVKPGDSDNVHDDTTEPGIGSFTVYPGDEKVYIESIKGDGGFPSLAYGAKAQAVRVFRSDVSMAKAVPGDGLETADLSIVDDGANLSDSIVDGLVNGTAYAFRIGLIDEAGNIVQFFPTNPVGGGSTCDNTPLDTSGACAYVATPDEVLGLLTEDMNCFIATASYGSSFEPHVQTLRKFRNKVLLRYGWGVAFVKKYYEYGPLAARFIHAHGWLKPVVRLALWPALGFSQLALKLGLLQAVLCSIAMVLMIMGPAMMWVRRCAERA